MEFGEVDFRLLISWDVFGLTLPVLITAKLTLLWSLFSVLYLSVDHQYMVIRCPGEIGTEFGSPIPRRLVGYCDWSNRY
jgi:hypothetical protein